MDVQNPKGSNIFIKMSWATEIRLGCKKQKKKTLQFDGGRTLWKNSYTIEENEQAICKGFGLQSAVGKIKTWIVCEEGFFVALKRTSRSGEWVYGKKYLKNCSLFFKEALLNAAVCWIDGFIFTKLFIWKRVLMLGNCGESRRLFSSTNNERIKQMQYIWDF